MEFSPFNPVIKLCLAGMDLEDKKLPVEALKMYFQAWEQAGNDSEKFLSAFYISRVQASVEDKLRWLETSVQLAIQVDDDTVKSAFPLLYKSIAQCYESMSELDKSKHNLDLANSYQFNPSDKGPFYHGTKADLKIGDMLLAGGLSNYKSDFKMNHIYFTGLVNGAGLAAALASGESMERVYIVEPTGPFENDPNLTDKKFPGNPSRSYRSESPLKIIGEVSEWERPSEQDLQKFRVKLSKSDGNIIN